jgi:hypothetical protein
MPIEDHEPAFLLRQVVADGKSRLSAADDHHVELPIASHSVISAARLGGGEDGAAEALHSSAERSISADGWRG